MGMLSCTCLDCLAKVGPSSNISFERQELGLLLPRAVLQPENVGRAAVDMPVREVFVAQGVVEDRWLQLSPCLVNNRRGARCRKNCQDDRRPM